MIRILKIAGHSMSPEYEDGDFVVIVTGSFFIRRLRAGDTIVFRHAGYGTLIKRIERLVEDGSLIVTGNRVDSLDSRRLGPVSPDRVSGKVVWHIHR